ncbi:MAG: hypothetical protein JXM70_07300 [Pirellulales bacterium]|nr:hypothetical protein [Pirellulales bacterium]
MLVLRGDMMMLPTEIDKKTLDIVQELVEANFGGRDELYAAADSMDKEDSQRICRRLADFLADNAIRLQQMLAASGNEAAGPLDIDAIIAALFKAVKARHGAAGVIEVAEEAQRDLKHGYDRAIEEASEPQAEGVLREQRDRVEFSEQVLRSIKPSQTKKPNPKKR